MFGGACAQIFVLIACRAPLRSLFFFFRRSHQLTLTIANASTTSLDLSPTSLKIGKQNFKMNGLDDPEKEHVFWEKEAFSGLHALESQEKYFDVVLLDPPTFSRIRLKGS